MTSMLLQVGVKALIKNKDGKYLLLKRNEIAPPATRLEWTIPGGRINPDELWEEGLKREIKEEVGLNLTSDPKVVDVQDIFRKERGFHIIRITFIVEANGEVNLSHNPENDHGEFKWANEEEMKDMPLEDQLRQTIAKI